MWSEEVASVVCSCACTFLLAWLLDYKYNQIKSSSTCLEGPLVFSFLCQWSSPWDAQ